MRVFLDTNVLVSAIATRGLCADVLRLVLTHHDLVIGEVVLVEVERVLSKKLKLPPEVVQDVLDNLRSSEVVPRPASTGDLSVRDPDDAWVLVSAVEGRAGVLVTGDDDLIVAAGQVPGLRILRPREFWELSRT